MSLEAKNNVSTPSAAEAAIKPSTQTSELNVSAQATFPPVTGEQTISGERYAKFLLFEAEEAKTRFKALIKSKGQDFTNRRNTLVIRRSDCKIIAPDQDVLAYIAIYEMKEAVTDSTKKIQVSDEEIAAYLILNPDFDKNVTLSEITALLPPTA